MRFHCSGGTGLFAEIGSKKIGKCGMHLAASPRGGSSGTTRERS